MGGVGWGWGWHEASVAALKTPSRSNLVLPPAARAAVARKSLLLCSFPFPCTNASDEQTACWCAACRAGAYNSGAGQEASRLAACSAAAVLRAGPPLAPQATLKDRHVPKPLRQRIIAFMTAK